MCIRDRYHDCFEDIYATISNYYSSNFSLMYLRAWDFIYNTNNNSVGKNLIAGEEYHVEDLYLYHGIKIQEQKLHQGDNITHQIRKAVHENGFIAVLVKADICNWVPVSLLRKSYHPIIIKQTDIVNHIIIDPYYLNNQVIQLPHSTVEKGICSYYRSEKGNPHYKSASDILYQFEQHVYRLLEKYSEYELFLNDFKSINQIQSEFTSVNGYVISDLYDQLIYLARRRKQTQMLLQALPLAQRLLQLNSEILRISQNWRKLAANILSAYYRCNWPEQYDEAIKMAEILIHDEKDILQKLMDIIRR